jgi:hypothetical protein
MLSIMYKHWQLHMSCSCLFVFMILMACVSQGNLVHITSHPINSQLAWCVPQLHHRMLGGVVPRHSLAGGRHLHGQPGVAVGKMAITHCFMSKSNKPDVFPCGALRARRDGADQQSDEFDGASQSFQGRHDIQDHVGQNGATRQPHEDGRFPGKNHDQDEKTSSEHAGLNIRPNYPPLHLAGAEKLSGAGAEPARARSSLYGTSTSPGGAFRSGTHYVSADDASHANQRRHRTGSRGEHTRSRGASGGRDAITSTRISENSVTLAREGYGEATRGRTGGSGYVRAADRQSSGHRSGGTGLTNAAGRRKPRKFSERGESLYAVAVRHEKMGNHAAARRIFEMLAVNA